MLGFDDKSLWKSAYISDIFNSKRHYYSSTINSASCDALYLRLMYLFQNSCSSERIQIILGSSSTSVDVGIIISILTTFMKYDHHSKSSL